MGRYKERSITQLLAKTSRLSKPRITPVLEGKAQMQGPLDELDADVDLEAEQACGNCRNSMEGCQVQCCSICARSYHNFCLEPLPDASFQNKQCCYKCQVEFPNGDLKQKSMDFGSTNDMADETVGSQMVSGCEGPEVVPEVPEIPNVEAEKAAEEVTCRVESADDSLSDINVVSLPTIKKSCTRRKRMPGNFEGASSSRQVKVEEFTEKTEEIDRKVKRYKPISAFEQDSRVSEPEHHYEANLSDAEDRSSEVHIRLKEAYNEGDMAKHHLQQTVDSGTANLLLNSSTNGDQSKKRKQGLPDSEILVEMGECDLFKGEECDEERPKDRKELKGSMNISNQQSRALGQISEGEGECSIDKVEDLLMERNIGEPTLKMDTSCEQSQIVIGSPSEEYVDGKLQSAKSFLKGPNIQDIELPKTCESGSLDKTDMVISSSVAAEAEISKNKVAICDLKQSLNVTGEDEEGKTIMVKNDYICVASYNREEGKNNKQVYEIDAISNVNELPFEDNPAIVEVDQKRSGFDLDLLDHVRQAGDSLKSPVLSDSQCMVRIQPSCLQIDSDSVTMKADEPHKLMESIELGDANAIGVLSENERLCILPSNDRKEKATPGLESGVASGHTNSAFLDDRDLCATSSPSHTHYGKAGVCPSAGLSAADKDTVESPTTINSFVGTMPESCCSPPPGNSVNTGDSGENKEQHSPLQDKVLQSDIENTSIAGAKICFLNQSVQLADITGSRISSEDEAKVCDICGDPGFEEMLAICSECNEGAEHIYCMQTLLDQLPEGSWLCEGCKVKQRTSGSKQCDPQPAGPCMLRSLSISSGRKQVNLGSARSRLSARLEKRKLGPDRRRALKGIPLLQGSAKRQADDLTITPAAKRQATESPNLSAQVSVPTMKPSLSRESSFKIPDSGKVKFISPTALGSIGTTVQNSGSNIRGTGKFLAATGASGSHSSRPSLGQSGQIPNKSRFASLSSFNNGTSISNAVNKVISSPQLNSTFPSVSSITTLELKSSGLSKSSDGLSSFLPSSKCSSGSGRVQTGHKLIKEGGDGLLSKDVFSGAQQSTNRGLSKANSFRTSKGAGGSSSPSGTAEQKVLLDASRSPYRLPGVRSMISDVNLVKTGESKLDVSSSILSSNDVSEPKAKILPASLVTAAPNSEALLPLTCVKSSSNLPTIETQSAQVRSLPSKKELHSASPCSLETEGYIDPLQHKMEILDMSRQCVADMKDETSEVQINLPKGSSLSQAKHKEIVYIHKEEPLHVPAEKQMASLPSSSSKDLKTVSGQDMSGAKALQRVQEGTGKIDSGGLDLVCEEKLPLFLDKPFAVEESGRNSSPKNRSSLTRTPSTFMSSIGLTRCYKCKELGHSAQSCTSRSYLPSSLPEGGSGVAKGPIFNSSCLSKNLKTNVDGTGGKWKSTATPLEPVTSNSLPWPEKEVPKMASPQVQKSNSRHSEVQMQEDKIYSSTGHTLPLLSETVDTGLKSKMSIAVQESQDNTNKFTSSSNILGMTNSISSGVVRDSIIVPQVPRSTSFNWRPKASLVCGSSSSPTATSPQVTLLSKSLSSNERIIANFSCSSDTLSMGSAVLHLRPESGLINSKDSTQRKSMGFDPAVAPGVDTAVSSRLSVSTHMAPFSMEMQTTGALVSSSNRGVTYWMSGTGTPGPLVSPSVKPHSQQYLSPQIEQLKSLVLPESYSLWRGAFEVAGKGNLPSLLDGIQAHPSNRAVQKVHEVTKKLVSPLRLEEHRRGSEYNSWPVQFQNSPPTVENIALYFFARDNDSYVRSYKPLVERMLKYDLALKGIIEDAELLVFSSNLLPESSQRWNQLMFLWAVFRDRKPNFNNPVGHHIPVISRQKTNDIDGKQFQRNSVHAWDGAEEDLNVNVEGSKEVDVSEKSTYRTGKILGNNAVPFVQHEPQTVQTMPLQSQLSMVQSIFKDRPQQHDEKSLENYCPVKTPFVRSSLSDVSSAGELQRSKTSPKRDESKSFELPPGFGSTSQRPDSSNKPVEEVDAHMEVATMNIPKGISNPVLATQKKDRVNSESPRIMPPFRQPSPSVIVCPSPRERQSDGWTVSRKSSRSRSRSPGRYRERDKERGGFREYNHERFRERERVDLFRAVYRERDRERERRQREREKQRDRERDRERERERGKERDWDRDRERERDRERGRERGRGSESGRDRRRRKDYDFVELEHDRESRHRRKYPYLGSLSRSPPGQRDRSRSPLSRWDRSLDRYHSRHHSRSYSGSPESDHGSGRQHLPYRGGESRERSQDSFLYESKAPAYVLSEQKYKDERLIENKLDRDSSAEVAIQSSQKGDSCSSQGPEHTKTSTDLHTGITDLNASPPETDGNGLEEVANSPAAIPSTSEHSYGSEYRVFFPAGFTGRGLVEQDESSNSGGKAVLNMPYSNCGPELLPTVQDSSVRHNVATVQAEPFSSCHQFFPSAGEYSEVEVSGQTVPNLELALGGKGRSSPRRVLPLFVQLLDTPGHPLSSNFRLPDGVGFSGAQPRATEDSTLALSLAFSEQTQTLQGSKEIDINKQTGDDSVNTSLCLFG